MDRLGPNAQIHAIHSNEAGELLGKILRFKDSLLRHDASIPTLPWLLIFNGFSYCGKGY
jgi:hypothetical protein